MKLILVLVGLSLTMILFGCGSNPLNGVFVCEKVKEKGTKKKKKLNLLNLFIGDDDCLYTQLEFKGNNTVVVTAAGQEFASTYIMDKEYLRIKTDQSDLLFKIQGDSTLIGEGFAEGLYKKQ